MQHRAILLIAAGANILAGLFYTLAVIQVLGVGFASDAYFFSLAITTFFLAIFSVPINSVVTTRLVASHSAEDWRLAAWAGHIGSAAIYLPIAIVVIATADIWLDVMLPGKRDIQLHKQILILQVIVMIFGGIQASALAAIQSRKKFIAAETITLCCAVLFYGPFLIALAKYGVVAASKVQLGRAFVQLLALLALSGHPVWQGTRNIMWDFIRQFRFPVIGGMYYKTDAVLDRYLLSQARDGLLSVYHLVQQVISMIVTLYARSFIAPLLVAAAGDIKSRNGARLKRRVQKHLMLSACIMMACMIAAFLASAAATPVGSLLHLPAELIVNAAELLIVLGGVVLGGLVGQAANTVFYATGRLSTPVWVGIASYTLVIPLKVLAFSIGGITGLALVASMYYLTNATILFMLQSRLLEDYT